MIGTYYGSWFSGPPYALQPEDINAARFTHVYYAFVLVSATNYTVKLGNPSMDSVLIPRFTASLTARNPCRLVRGSPIPAGIPVPDPYPRVRVYPQGTRDVSAGSAINCRFPAIR